MPGGLSSENLTAWHLASGGGRSPKEEGTAFCSGTAEAAAVAFAVFSSVDARNSVQPTLAGKGTHGAGGEPWSLAEVACPKDDATSSRWARSEL